MYKLGNLRFTSGRSVFCLLIPFQFMFGLIYAWGGIAPVIHAQTAWSNSILDLAFSITPLSLLPSVLIGGRLAGSFPPVRVLGAAVACFVVGSVLGLCSDSPVLFIVGYSCIALGIGGGLATPACIALIGRTAPTRQGRLSGALLAVYGLSAVVSTPLFHLLTSHMRWQPALGFMLGVYGLLGLVALVLLPKPPARTGAVEHQRISTWQLFTTRPVLISSVLILVSAPFGSMTFAALGRLAASQGFDNRVGITAVAIMALANGVGRFAAGMLSDLLTPPVSRRVVLACGAAGYAVLLVGTHVHAVALFLLFPVLVGFAFGGLAGKLPALAAHTVASHATEVFAIYFGVFALGSFGGPLLSAVLGLPIALTILGSFAVIAFVASLIKNRSTQEIDSSFRVSVPD
jgi:MFS family permease